MAWWYNALIHFMSRVITNQADLLPAVAGIAIEVKKRTGYNYACGLWKEDIHRGLLWTSGEVTNGSTNDTVPSWSWASRSIPHYTPLRFLEKYVQGPRAEITEYRIETIGNMEFAPVIRAMLTVRANCRSLGLTTREIQCHVDGEGLLTVVSYDELVARGAICMQVAIFNSQGNLVNFPRLETVFGLLLERSDKVIGAYRRIGVFQFAKESGWADGWTEKSVDIV